MTWTCPHCNTENPETSPVCMKCDEIRLLTGGGVGKIDVVEIVKSWIKEQSSGQ